MHRRSTRLGRLHRQTLLTLLCFAPFLATDAQRATASRVPPQAAYLGQKPPGETPEPFAPRILAANPFLGPLAFSPDGTECFFTVDDAWYTTQSLFVTRYVNGAWTPQVLAPFVAGFEKSAEAYFSPDGNRLYFTAQAKGSATRMDLWMVDRSGAGWGTPVRLPAPINSDANEFHFNMGPDRTIYFLSNRSGTPQIYRARQNAAGTVLVELIPAPFLSVGTYDGDPTIAPDGRFLVFHSGRAGGFGAVDLYVSFPDGKGEWTKPINLGAGFNTAVDEYGAMLSPDGKYLFFVRHSLKKGELFWVSTRAIEKRATQQSAP
jgi:Tol biopolymer transport system component